MRRYRPDVGILISETPAVAVGVFTQNQCKAAPVLYTQALVPSNRVRAILTNSGQANAATGDDGIRRNFEMVQAAAKALDCDTEQVLVASTGVIGDPLASEKIIPSIPELIDRAAETAESFALAILTTDLVPKTVTTQVQLSQGLVRITGISKGSGMIHPNMATMLGYLLTDAELEMDYAGKLLKRATDQSFNMISVDGDSSTNDCCFLMANGKSKVALKTPEDFENFERALTDVAIFLAKSIAADGEGATKLIEVSIRGSDNLEVARRAARGVTISPLIKTAIHGEDPNWGRVLARLGAEQVPFWQLDKMDMFMQGVSIIANGKPQPDVKTELRGLLRQSKIAIEIDLKSGPLEVTAWGCDLSKKYVDINTEYS